MQKLVDLLTTRDNDYVFIHNGIWRNAKPLKRVSELMAYIMGASLESSLGLIKKLDHVPKEHINC